MERRTFLRTAALSALAAVSTSSLSLGQNAELFQRARARQRALTDQMRARQRARRGGTVAPTKIPIAVQLYSVRNAANRDLAGTLAAIAKMGYDGVEFAGYYGKDAKDIRKMLDDTGLKCAGTHTGIGQFRGDNFEKTAEIHLTLGTKFMIVPGGIDSELHDVERNKRMAEEFNRLAEKAKPLGLVIGYHAHGGDARLIDDIPAWERLFDATVPAVVHQMDIGNYMGGYQGTPGDPYKMIEKFKGRSRTVHLKEGGRGNPIIGSGTVEWDRVFELCETVGGTEWYIVEDEVAPDNFERIEKCIVALREMGK